MRHSSHGRFLLRATVFLGLLLLLDHVVLAWVALPVLYRHQPTVSHGAFVFAEGQLARVEYLAGTRAKRKVPFVGSSSVVNGVDTGIVCNRWGRAGVEAVPLNYGVTAFLASELPFFKRYLIRSDVTLVVYLYNTFSFSEGLHPQSTRIAWDTAEFLRFATPYEVSESLPTLASGLLTESLFAIRFQDLLHVTLSRYASGTLVERPHPYDYPLRDAALPRQQSVLEPPLPPDDWARSIYLTSDTDEETLGYRGLARFLSVAREGGIPVVVMPAPEPQFASLMKYRRDVDVGRIDRHVERICNTQGARFVPRSETASLEREDDFFRDHVHLNREGRNRYSLWLADKVAAILRGR